MRLSMYKRKIKLALVSVQARQYLTQGALDGLNWLTRWSDLIMDSLHSLRRSQEFIGQLRWICLFPYRSQERLFCLFLCAGHKPGTPSRVPAGMYFFTIRYRSCVSLCRCFIWRKVLAGFLAPCRFEYVGWWYVCLY